jgi:hypothetical protein
MAVLAAARHQHTHVLLRMFDVNLAGCLMLLLGCWVVAELAITWQQSLAWQECSCSECWHSNMSPPPVAATLPISIHHYIASQTPS